MLEGYIRLDWALGLALAITVLAVIINCLQLNELYDEQQKTKALKKEVARLKYLLAQKAQAPPPVVVVESAPKNWGELQRVINGKMSRQGGRAMSNVKEKGVVREVGFMRLVMMVGLAVALANMAMTAWSKIKHRFAENDEVEPDLFSFGKIFTTSKDMLHREMEAWRYGAERGDEISPSFIY